MIARRSHLFLGLVLIGVFLFYQMIMAPDRGKAYPLGEVALVLDDGTQFGTFGVSYLDGTAKEFVWLNRFTPDPAVYPFALEEVWVLFDQGDGSNNVHVDDPIDLVIYEDDDGNPTNGAALLATFSKKIKSIDGTTWSKYTLSPAVTFDDPGDVLIGVINRYVQDGVSAKTYPAAVDMTNDQGRSYYGWWQAGVPDPAILPPDDEFKLKVGNWMIRGYGQTEAEISTPTATKTKKPSATPTSTPKNSTKTPVPEEGYIFLPCVVCSWPPEPTRTPTPELAVVYVQNDTGGNLCYEVLGTGIGEKCFPSGKHVYGSFSPGSYSWKVSANCGSSSGTRTFSSGEYTHRFWCM